MAKNVLHIVETGYRATLEEQDDPVLWLSQALRGNGLAVSVLLRGTAANYVVRDQDASGLRFGEVRQTQPPRLEEDLRRLGRSGAGVYVVAEDLAALGVTEGEVLEVVTAVPETALPSLLRSFDHVLQW